MKCAPPIIADRRGASSSGSTRDVRHLARSERFLSRLNAGALQRVVTITIAGAEKPKSHKGRKLVTFRIQVLSRNLRCGPARFAEWK